MEDERRSEAEEQFEQLCIAVTDGELHEQEAIEFFERQQGEEGFDAAAWLDIALYYSVEVARGVLDMVAADQRYDCRIGEIIADNLDIAYDADECAQFAEALQLAINNGIPVDLPEVLEACERAITDMGDWADDEQSEPLRLLRDEIERLMSAQ